MDRNSRKKSCTTVVSFWKHKEKSVNDKSQSMNSILVSYAHEYTQVGKDRAQFVYPKECQAANSAPLLTTLIRWQELGSAFAPSLCLSPFLPSPVWEWIHRSREVPGRQLGSIQPSDVLPETASVQAQACPVLPTSLSFHREGSGGAGRAVCESKSTVHNKLRSGLFLGFSAKKWARVPVVVVMCAVWTDVTQRKALSLRCSPHLLCCQNIYIPERFLLNLV